MTARPTIDLELRIGGAAPAFTLAATRRDPESAADTELLPEAPLALDLHALRAAELDPRAYGRLLAGAVFAKRSFWEQAQAYAAGRGADLRLRLRIAESAAALHALRWERICDPDGDPVAASGRVALLRYVPSRDPQPVPAPALDALRALVAVACPNDAARYGLSVFNAAAEHERALQALAGAPWVAALAPDAPAGRATPARLNELLRHGCELLYLACHGTLGPQGQPVLWLEREDGTAERLPGAELVRQLAALDEGRRPLLVILAVCHSAGGDGSAASAALGHQLARAGIPAVLAMQGLAPVDLVARFVPTVLQELFQHGSIDRAVAVARADLPLDTPWWLPVLYTRVEDGRLWRDASPAVRAPLRLALGPGAPSRALAAELAARGLPPDVDIAGADGHLLHVTPERLADRRGFEVALAQLRQEVRASGVPVLVLRDGVSQRKLRPLVNSADLGWAEAELAAGEGALRVPATTMLDLVVGHHARQRIRSGAIPIALFCDVVAAVDPPPALLLDWSSFYADGAYPTPELWGRRLLPALADLRKVLRARGVRQIDLTARARMGAGLAFGYAFREVAGTVIRVRQGPSWWRTAPHDPRRAPFGEVEPERVGEGPDLTVELNINRQPGEVQRFVDAYLDGAGLPVGHRLRLDRLDGPSMAINELEAQGVAAQVRTLLQRHRRPGGVIHLFMAAPLGLAVLIGWHLNGLTPLQYYELPQGGAGYAPACKLEAL